MAGPASQPKTHYWHLKRQTEKGRRKGRRRDMNKDFKRQLTRHTQMALSRFNSYIRKLILIKSTVLGWGCSSVTEHKSSMHKGMGWALFCCRNNKKHFSDL
jgi:hypothetical protein